MKYLWQNDEQILQKQTFSHIFYYILMHRVFVSGKNGHMYYILTKQFTYLM